MLFISPISILVRWAAEGMPSDGTLAGVEIYEARIEVPSSIGVFHSSRDPEIPALTLAEL
jgi:hypothetical protein